MGLVEAQRCAATLPVRETGVARARAAGAEGDHHETVSRLRSTAKRIFSHGRSRGVCMSNPAADLNDAFTAPKAKPRPALTDPAAVAELLRRIDAYAGKGPL